MKAPEPSSLLLRAFAIIVNIIFIYPQHELYSQYNDTSYVRLDGIDDDITTISTIDEALTGDIDIRALIRPDTWTPSTDSHILAKANFGNDDCFRFAITSKGELSFTWHPAGLTSYRRGGKSTAPLKLADGTLRYVRVTTEFFENDGKGPYQCSFYTSGDGTTWTQLGKALKGVNGNFINASDPLLKIGSSGGVPNGGNKRFQGEVYWLEVRDGIDGPIVERFDASKGDGTYFENIPGQDSWINNGGEHLLASSTPTLPNIIETESIPEDFDSLLKGILLAASEFPNAAYRIIKIKSANTSHESGEALIDVKGAYGVLTVESNADNDYSYSYDLLNENGALDFLSPSDGELEDIFEITVQTQEGLATFNYVARLHGTNDAPTLANPITSIPSAQAGDSTYYFTFSSNVFTDPDNPASTFIWTLESSDNLIPSWISFDPHTSTLSLASPIPSGAAGNYQFSLGVIDPYGTHATQKNNFSFAVSTPTNRPPTLAQSITPPDAIVGKFYSFKVPVSTFSDDGLPNPPGTLIWKLMASTPIPGLTVSDNDSTISPTISGTPTTPGVHQLTVHASDSELSASTSFLLTISEVASGPETSDQGGLSLSNSKTTFGSKIDLEDQDLIIENSDSDARIRFRTGSTEALVIADNGSIGIGVETPNPESLLTVDGVIYAQGLVLKAQPADFVFEEGYQLPELEAVHDFIKTNHHLPGIPAGPEMEKAGISLVAYNQLLLQKIEELTLYIIEKDLQISELERKVDELYKAASDPDTLETSPPASNSNMNPNQER